MSRELLARALDALGTSTWDHTRAVGKQELITALRAALAQPEPIDGFGGNLDDAFDAPAPAVPPPIDNRFVAPGCEQFGTRADAESLLAMLRTTLNEYMRLAAPAPAVPNGAVPPGSWEHLKVMMQHSAWEGTLQLCDALANIEDFAKSAAPAVPDNIADLLEDYVMARVETALFNNHVWPQGTPVRMAKPRKDKLMSAIGASLSAAPAVREPLTREQQIAIREAHCNTASDEYFGARPQVDDATKRRIYEAGFKEGWESGIGGGNHG